MFEPNKLILVLFAFLLNTNVASAQSRSAPALERARSSLAHYDVEGTETFDTVRDLAVFATSNAPEAQRNEARFLRAMVGADFVIIAKLTDDAALLARTATAFGATPETLVAELDHELAAAGRGLYASPAREEREALHASREERPDFAAIRGLRRDALFVRALSTCLRGEEDALAAFASVGKDPCAGAPTCAGVAGGVSSEVRAALRAAEDFDASARRLERASRAGDPVSPYVERDVATARESVARLAGREAMHAPVELHLAEMAQGATTSADVLVIVGTGTVRYAYLPHLAIDSSGVARLAASGEPGFPSFTSIPMPVGDVATTVPALVSALTARPNASPLRVAIGGEDSTTGGDIARALRSVALANATLVGLAGRQSNGTLRIVPVTSGTSPDGDARVSVLPGGYEVQIGRGRTKIPRVDDGGAFRFDVASLERRLARRTFPRASIRFAGRVPYGAVASAVSRLAVAHPVVLVMPR